VIRQQIPDLFIQDMNPVIFFSQLLLEFSDIPIKLSDDVSRMSLTGARIGHIARCALSDAVVAAFWVPVAWELSTLEMRQLVFGQ
jgi:hypothetical protein